MSESVRQSSELLSVENCSVERSRTLVRCLHVDSGASGASGTLSEILCDGGLGSPLVATHDTVLALHVLDDEDVVVVIEISSCSRCRFAYRRMHRHEFVELRL